MITVCKTEDVLMRCTICSYEWVEILLPDENGEYYAEDDLCPRCGAQGEPAEGEG